VLTKEELLAKARKPAADALRLHPLYRRKCRSRPSAPSMGSTVSGA